MAGQQQPHQQQQQQPQVQLRLFFLTQHLILQCFNNLDDLSRKHAFEVMGWPRDNYLRRQQMLRDQLENAKKEKAKQKEQAQQQKELAAVAEDGEGETNEERERATSNEEGEGTIAEVEEDSLEATEADLDADKGADDAEEATTADDKGENGVEEDDNNEVPSDEAKDEAEVTEEEAVVKSDEQGEDGDEGANGAVDNEKGENGVDVDDNNELTSEEANVDLGEGAEDTAATSDEQGEDGEDEQIDEAAQEDDDDEEEPEIDDNDNPLLLPLLSAPIDPQTLLDRLNTRRLFARILYYKREQRRKVEEEASKALSGEDNADGDASNDKDWMPGMGGPIQKMYRDLLKEKVTADRIWRKNLTIEELANLEWNELLKVAELR